ncbi:MAG TPA: ABC transporter permease, partial [Nocardioides sp.]
GIGAIVLAHLVFVGMRTLLACTAFVLVLTPFGLFATWWAPLVTILVQVLVIGSFAAPVYAYSAGLDNEWAFNLLFRLGMIPMFLFSGAFFPVANLAAPLELLAKLTPLWHGVDLTRMVALGTLDAGAVVLHVVYLLALTVLGAWLAVRRLRTRMVS